MNITVLDGAFMTDKKSAHSYIAKTLGFPAFYGGNLDALYDCLTVLPRPLCIVIENSILIKEALGEYGETMLEVFNDAADGELTVCIVDDSDFDNGENDDEE